MLAQLVGQVDWNSAIVLCVLFIVAGVVATTLIAKRRSRQELQQEFDLAKIKQQNERDLSGLKIDREWGYKEKALAQNLITSHARDED